MSTNGKKVIDAPPAKPKGPSLNDLPPLAFDADGEAIEIPEAAQAFRVHHALRSRTGIVTRGRPCMDPDNGRPLYIGVREDCEMLRESGCEPGLYALCLVDGYGRELRDVSFAVVEVRDENGKLPASSTEGAPDASAIGQLANVAAIFQAQATAMVEVARANAETAKENAKAVGQLVAAFATRVKPSSEIVTTAEPESEAPKSLTEAAMAVAKAVGEGFGQRMADKAGDVAANIVTGGGANGAAK